MAKNHNCCSRDSKEGLWGLGAEVLTTEPPIHCRLLCFEINFSTKGKLMNGCPWMDFDEPLRGQKGPLTLEKEDSEGLPFMGESGVLAFRIPFVSEAKSLVTELHGYRLSIPP
ncbi:hypothetical protein VNO77_08459 [Canavalia gladiata]|uniref:Uncharacterized protein n=1 Tax=Canavalia gladiata TaxID=3824 RepID=A0AAN9ME24_CANGL